MALKQLAPRTLLLQELKLMTILQRLNGVRTSTGQSFLERWMANAKCNSILNVYKSQLCPTCRGFTEPSVSISRAAPKVAGGQGGCPITLEWQDRANFLSPRQPLEKIEVEETLLRKYLTKSVNLYNTALINLKGKWSEMEKRPSRCRNFDRTFLNWTLS